MPSPETLETNELGAVDAEAERKFARLRAVAQRESAARERAEALLKDAVACYRNLFVSWRDAVFAIDGTGRITSLNPGFEAITGLSPVDWIGARGLRLIHPADRKRVLDRLRVLKKGVSKTGFDARIRAASGGWITLDCNVAPRRRDGVVEGYLGVARDVTMVRRAEQELRDRAMAATSEGIVITNPHLAGNPLIYVNHGFERLSGYGGEEALGRSLQILQGAETDPAAAEAVREAIEHHRACTVVLKNYRKDGSVFWCRWSLTPVLGERGEVANFIVILSDETKQKEADRIKNDLISTVSHELRTPLTSMRGFAELMLEKEFPPEKRRKFIEIINKEATRLTNLINDFLDIQRMESGRQVYHFTRMALVQTIQEAVAVFRGSNSGHEFVFELEEGLPLVRADHDRVHQVLSNLCSNAVKFSPKGGAIRVGARRQEGYSVCWVADQGIGIPADALPKLFQKFGRVDNSEARKIGGTGLGLALVKEIVEAHKGRVWVESEVGKGTTFFFSLPFAD